MFMESMNVKMTGTVLVRQAFVRVEGAVAVIVNGASAAGFVIAQGEVSAYTVSKVVSVAFFSCLQVGIGILG